MDAYSLIDSKTHETNPQLKFVFIFNNFLLSFIEPHKKISENVCFFVLDIYTNEINYSHLYYLH